MEKIIPQCINGAPSFVPDELIDILRDSVIRIEIKKEDNIPEYKYLFPDLNYKNGIKHYLNAEIYTAGYPNVKIHRGDKHYSAGIITKVDENGYIFEHNCNTKDGSSGCPIINYNKFVIGIHYGYDKENKMNYGTFIGKIINELFLEEKNINPLMNDDSINKEDEKEEPKLKMPNIKEIDLGMHMLERFLDNEDFMNIAGQIAKNINDEQLMSNITKGLLNDFMPNPNDIDKFKDKNNNIDLKAITKYTYEKMGFSENEQNEFVENYMKLLNNPNIKEITKDIIKNNKNLNDNINKENFDKKSEDNK